MNREFKIGEKSFFKIGEVSAITKLPASVLRFWEAEFSFLKPRKSQGRHRVYDRQTIETVLEIKRMLYEEGYTIVGLKRHWRRRRSQSQLAGLPSEKVAQVRNELQDILGILNSYSTKSGQVSVQQ